MNIQVLDAVILFALTVPVVMHYRILPVEGTPYWLFGVLFLTLSLNVIVSYNAVTLKKRIGVDALKTALLLIALSISFLSVLWTAIADRAKVAPEYKVHDIILQQEAAMRYLIVGKNPYSETYFGTPVEKFGYDEMGKPAENPALYHFVMPPFYLLFPFLFYYPAVHLLGFFDGRMALLFTCIGSLIVLYVWFKNVVLRNSVIILTALSPAVIDYLVEGRSDYFALFFLLLSLFLLTKNKIFLSAVVFALSVLSKQTIWFAIPFYVASAYFQTNRKISRLVIPVIGSLITCMLFTAPFLIWNAKAFFDSVVFYLSGNTLHSYPISGYGFGMLLYSFGIIRDIHSYFPFGIWQGVIGTPILIVMLRWYSAKPTPSRFFISYALTLLVFWYFSRYFNNSHISFVSSLIVIGLMKQWDETSSSNNI